MPNLSLDAFSRSVMLLTIAIGFVAGPVRAIDPDEVISNIGADSSATSCADATCEAIFDLPSSTLQLKTTAGGDQITETSATLSAEFEVSAASADPADENKLSGSTVSMSVEAFGTLGAVGTASDAGYRIDVRVTDLDDGSVAAAQKIAEGRIRDGAAEIDAMELVVLSPSLTRGHRYRVDLLVKLDATAEPLGSASADLLMNDGFVRWQNLTVAAGSDPFEAIADLAGRVDALEDRTDELEGELDQLREDFDGHSHEYLTGRGNGHNNTLATTTTPDGDSGSPSVDMPGNSENSLGAPGRRPGKAPGPKAKKGKKR